MKKFKIPAVPPTTSKSIRFPNDVIEQVETQIQGKDWHLHRLRSGSGAVGAGKPGRTAAEKSRFFSNTPGIILPLPAILTQDSTLSRYKEVFMV